MKFNIINLEALAVLDEFADKTGHYEGHGVSAIMFDFSHSIMTAIEIGPERFILLDGPELPKFETVSADALFSELFERFGKMLEKDAA